jgi:hypothetical protein
MARTGAGVQDTRFATKLTKEQLKLGLWWVIEPLLRELFGDAVIGIDGRAS